MCTITKSKYTVSFDLDGTLVRNFFIEAVFPRLFREFVKLLSSQGIDSPAGLISAMHRIHLERLKNTQSIRALDWDENFRLLLRDDLQPGSKPFERALFEALNVSKPELYPDVRATMSELIKDRSLELVILSNGYARYQIPILEVTGLNSYFTHVYTSDIIGVLKPDKEAFLKIKKETPNYILHCGDKLVEDVGGANQAGLKSAWVNRQIDLGHREYFNIEEIGSKALEQVSVDSGGILPNFIITSLNSISLVIKKIKQGD